jgi:hypothetical protein
METRSSDAGPSGAGSSAQQGKKDIILNTPFQRKKDVFDADDFQPIKFINQIYPDGGRRAVATPHAAAAAASAAAAARAAVVRRTPLIRAAPLQRRPWGIWTSSWTCSASR